MNLVRPHRGSVASVHVAIAGMVTLGVTLALGSATAGARLASPRDLPEGRWETIAAGNDVLALALDGDVLWSGTRAGGLVRWDTGAGTYTQYLRPQDPLTGNTIYDIAVGVGGRKWLATDGGLTMLDDRGTPATGDAVWRGYTRASTYGGLPSDDVRAVAVSGNLVWVGARQMWDPTTSTWTGGGIGRLDTRGTDETADDVWAPVATFQDTIREGTDGSRRLGLVSDNVTDIVITPTGDLWVATSPHWLYEKPEATGPAKWTRRHGGLSFLDTRGTTTPTDDIWTATDCEEMQVTVTCQVQALALDRDGSVWAALGGRGVMSFPATEAPVIDEQSRVLALRAGTADDFVDGIAVAPPDVPALANTVWLARRKGGVSVVDHRGTPRRTGDDFWDLDRGGPFTRADGLARDRTQALTVGGGAIWIGTGPVDGNAGGISRLDLDTLTFGSPLVTTNAPPMNFVTDLALGQPGTRWAAHVWLATGSRAQRRFGAGAVDLDTRGTTSRSDDTWTTYATVGTDADGRAPWSGLAGDNVQAVAVTGDRVWIGSAEATWSQSAGKYTDGGAAVFDGDAWASRTVENTRNGTRPGLRHGSVSTIAPGCADDLWIGTGNGWDFWGAGVDRLTPSASIDVRAMDTWEAYSYPALAGNNTTGIAVDCPRGQVWVTAEHHVTPGDPSGGSAGGDHVGGGAAVFDIATRAWMRYDVRNGLDCFARRYINCEATSVTVGRAGDVWIGAYGTKDMESSALVHENPFYPAVVNHRAAGETGWTREVFAGAGRVGALSVDLDGRLWVATTRDGAARGSPWPENWQTDRGRGGLMVDDAGTWRRLEIADSGIPSDDISDIAVAPDGDVWIATEGWGLARFAVGETAATATPTNDAPTPTVTPTRTASVESTPTARSRTPTPRPVTPTVTHGPTRWVIALPITQTVRRQPRRLLTLPLTQRSLR
jgi:hypothetical protein